MIPQPQCPHSLVAPVWCVVTTCPCLIHGWGLRPASQERKELPWGLAQFQTATGHTVEALASCLGLGLGVEAADGPEGALS